MFKKLKVRIDIFMMSLASSQNVFGSLRRKIYTSYGICDKSTFISPNCYIEKPRQLKLGSKCFVNRGTSFGFGYNNNTEVKIGNNVWIAPNVTFYCSTHTIGTPSQRAGETIPKSIYVGDGTWIGMCATILPGVSIGKGCVIAAGAVVISDVPDNEMWGGVPARFIKKLPVS